MYGEYRRYVQQHIDLRAQLEQLAEESAELTQAVLKLIRAVGNGNPTPVTRDEALEHVGEELGDVLAVWCLLSEDDSQDDNPKWKRWAERIKEGLEHAES